MGLTYSVLDDRGDAISAARISHDVGIHTFQLYDDIAVKTYSHQKSGLHYWYVVHVASRDLSSLRSLIIPDKLDGSEIEAIVLDTASDKLGGTGKSFNWNWIAETRAAGELEGLPPIILAGGLNPENVADAIRIARPYAVDVSSGVEVAGKPGVKDAIKMRDFIQAAHGA
ncbi:MAG TPA: phosphoribosylanthranilate isomerase [Phycisphaerae bacterium]|nr:phosphoribosylanthranilate isomerase [Phycisphaerae bacterium]